MKKKCIMGTIVGLMLVMSAAAQDTGWTERWRYDPNADKFNAPDATLDLFGTWADRDRFGGEDDSFGGGLGFTMYFIRFLGISADSYIEEWKWPYRANASLLVRLPLGQTGLAPYGFGGGGRQWKYIPQYTAHAGAGLQLKLNPHTALFGDWRRVFPEVTQDHHLVRFGLNLGF